MARRSSDSPRPCGKKRLSQSKAQGIINAARRSRNPSRQERRAYFCRGCECWHTTAAPYLTAQQRRAFSPLHP